MTLEQITSGSWAARWGNWTILLRKKTSWEATVRCRDASQFHACDGFASPQDAATWACDTMRARGAKVMILDRPSITLESLLRFNPAPEALA